jgi:UrcA family protein
MTSRTRHFLPALLVLATAHTLAPSAGAEAVPPRTASVDISDLDLADDAGARAALKRITVAALQACGGEPIPSPAFPRARDAWRDCVRDAVDGAVTAADAPLLAHLHHGATTSLAVASKD